MNTTFLNEVILGLSKKPKEFSSKYFYDDKGDKIFQEIMQMEEYYLPKYELEILLNQTESIVNSFGFDQLDVIGLGSGDGSKTKHFLKKIIDFHLVFFPISLT